MWRLVLKSCHLKQVVESISPTKQSVWLRDPDLVPVGQIQAMFSC
jgi:hypothetical protein